ncbi:uncharacterized protein ACBT44_016296 isoform 1-T2 [Syngnathus typhle]
MAAGGRHFASDEVAFLAEDERWEPSGSPPSVQAKCAQGRPFYHLLSTENDVTVAGHGPQPITAQLQKTDMKVAEAGEGRHAVARVHSKVSLYAVARGVRWSPKKRQR